MSIPDDPALKIGHLTLPTPVILAPLAGYTDPAFRLLCRKAGASLCFSEMISCHGLVYKQKNTEFLLKTLEEERPVGIQLFGSDPVMMGKAAAIVSTCPVDLIDINMGCPVRKVVKKGAGSALMKTPELAKAIIESVCAHTHLPVTVKIRAGWASDDITAVSFAQMAELAGVTALTVHGRTWAQGFGGLADWNIIRQVTEAVSIPVIGNGDISSHADGIERMLQTGCHGVMVGRGALGNPWIFSPEGRPATLEKRIPVLLDYLDLCRASLPWERYLFRIKNQAGRYFSGLPGAAKLRAALYGCDDLQQMTAALRRLEDQGNQGGTCPVGSTFNHL